MFSLDDWLSSGFKRGKKPEWATKRRTLRVCVSVWISIRATIKRSDNALYFTEDLCVWVFPKNFIWLGAFLLLSRKGLSIFRKPTISCIRWCYVKKQFPKTAFYSFFSLSFALFVWKFKFSSVNPSKNGLCLKIVQLFCFVSINAINHAIFAPTLFEMK